MAVEHLGLLALGFGIVMGVLIALWAVCAIVGTAFTKGEAAKAARAAASAPAAVPAAAPTPQIAEGIPSAHVAAIAAAVASLSSSYRVVRVTAPAHDVRAWAAQGRYEQQAKWPTQPAAVGGVVLSRT